MNNLKNEIATLINKLKNHENKFEKKDFFKNQKILKKILFA